MNPRHILSISMLAFALSCGGNGDDGGNGNEPTPEEQTAQDLQGQWLSVNCESIGNNFFIQRDFTFTNDTWLLNVGIFSNDQCTDQALDVTVGGSFSVVAASAIADAFDTDFGFNQRDITVLDPNIVFFLNTQPPGSCGEAQWEEGVTQSIQNTGCDILGFPSQADCPTELDVVKIDGTTLFLGDRSTDLCAARATALGVDPLAKQ
jgi:hypothetical protein